MTKHLSPEQRALRKFERIKAREPGNPAYNEQYLQMLIEDEHKLEAFQTWLALSEELYRRCRRESAQY